MEATEMRRLSPKHKKCRGFGPHLCIKQSTVICHVRVHRTDKKFDCMNELSFELVKLGRVEVR